MSARLSLARRPAERRRFLGGGWQGFEPSVPRNRGNGFRDRPLRSTGPTVRVPLRTPCPERFFLRPSDPLRLLHDANSQLEAIQGLAAVNAGVVVKCAPARHLGRRLWRGVGARFVGEDARPDDGVCRRGDGRPTPALPRPTHNFRARGSAAAHNAAITQNPCAPNVA